MSPASPPTQRNLSIVHWASKTPIGLALQQAIKEQATRANTFTTTSSGLPQQVSPSLQPPTRTSAAQSPSRTPSALQSAASSDSLHAVQEALESSMPHFFTCDDYADALAPFLAECLHQSAQQAATSDFTLSFTAEEKQFLTNMAPTLASLVAGAAVGVALNPTDRALSAYLQKPEPLATYRPFFQPTQYFKGASAVIPTRALGALYLPIQNMIERSLLQYKAPQQTLTNAERVFTSCLTGTIMAGIVMPSTLMRYETWRVPSGGPSPTYRTLLKTTQPACAAKAFIVTAIRDSLYFTTRALATQILEPYATNQTDQELCKTMGITVGITGSALLNLYRNDILTTPQDGRTPSFRQFAQALGAEIRSQPIEKRAAFIAQRLGLGLGLARAMVGILATESLYHALLPSE